MWHVREHEMQLAPHAHPLVQQCPLVVVPPGHPPEGPGRDPQPQTSPRNTINASVRPMARILARKNVQNRELVSILVKPYA